MTLNHRVEFPYFICTSYVLHIQHLTYHWSIRPVVIIIFAQISVRPSVCISNIAKEKCPVKIMIIIGGIVGLAEGIIDDTCLLLQNTIVETSCTILEVGQVSEPLIDPLGRPTISAVSDHYLCTCCPSVRPSVRPSPLFKSSTTKQQKIMVATFETVCLAEWIIDDTCLVLYNIYSQKCMYYFIFYLFILLHKASVLWPSLYSLKL